MIGFDDSDADKLVRGGIGLLVLFALGAAVVAVAAILHGCARPPKPETAIEAATYAAELEACAVQSSTCLGYVACRQRVAAAHGRTYTARCLP